MRYTNYIINGRFVDLDSIQTNNWILKYPTLALSLACAGIVLLMLTGALPFAIAFDELRTLKYQYIKLKRKYYGIRK